MGLPLQREIPCPVLSYPVRALDAVRLMPRFLWVYGWIREAGALRGCHEHSLSHQAYLTDSSTLDTTGLDSVAWQHPQGSPSRLIVINRLERPKSSWHVVDAPRGEYVLVCAAIGHFPSTARVGLTAAYESIKCTGQRTASASFGNPLCSVQWWRSG